VQPAEASGYASLDARLRANRMVVLDGGIGSELERLGFPRERNTGRLWGTRALYEAPGLTLEVHRRYAAAGVHVLTTNTWQIGTMPEAERLGAVDASRGGWRDRAALAVRLAREAAAERPAPPAIAYSLSSRCLASAFLAELLESLVDDPPDLFLLETLISLPEDIAAPLAQLRAFGRPVWVAYRRCRAGVCDVHGQVVRADGVRFATSLALLEQLDVSAVLINCLPPDQADGTLPFLRGHTRLPLGLFPNLGRYLDPGWEFDEYATPEAFARRALAWREIEQAQIVGGCCGVGPEHVAALVSALATDEGGSDALADR
jgi:S-methylmethionine-dependent homocysteine/selenocysteine methylase